MPKASKTLAHRAFSCSVSTEREKIPFFGVGCGTSSSLHVGLVEYACRTFTRTRRVVYTVSNTDAYMEVLSARS